MYINNTQIIYVLILIYIQVHYTIYWILYQALFRENAEKSMVFALFGTLQCGVLRKNYRELKIKACKCLIFTRFIDGY